MASYKFRMLMRKAMPTNEEERWKVVGWSIQWEGCIALKKNGKRFTPVITIDNTEPESLTKFQEIIGYGHILPKKVLLNENRKPQWQWLCNKTHDCAFILTHVLDYLPVNRKREVATLLLEYCMAHEHRAKPSLRDVEIYATIKTLNHKGLR